MKKVKINCGFAQDGNFNDLLMNKVQATKYCKKYKKHLEAGYARAGINFKFKHFSMIEKESYFTCSMA